MRTTIDMFSGNYHLEECFWRFGRNCVWSEHVSPVLKVAPVPRQAGTRTCVEFASDLGAAAQRLDLADPLLAPVLHELPELLEGHPVPAARGHGEAVGGGESPAALGSANLQSHTYLQTTGCRTQYLEHITQNFDRDTEYTSYASYVRLPILWFFGEGGDQLASHEEN